MNTISVSNPQKVDWNYGYIGEDLDCDTVYLDQSEVVICFYHVCTWTAVITYNLRNVLSMKSNLKRQFLST